METWHIYFIKTDIHFISLKLFKNSSFNYIYCIFGMGPASFPGAAGICGTIASCGATFSEFSVFFPWIPSL